MIDQPVLITGTSGNLGKKVLTQVSKDHQVISISRHPTVQLNNAIHLISDLLDFDQTRLALDKFSTIPLIVHVAGITDVNGHSNFNDNVKMAQNIVKIAKQKETKKIIFISSNSVNYSDRPYAKTKKEAENIFISSGIAYTILRPTLILDFDSPEIKKLINILKSSFFIPLPNKGLYKIQPIHIRDLVKLIDLSLTQGKNKIYSVGGKEAITTVTFFRLLTQYLGINKNIIELPDFLTIFIQKILRILKLNSLNDQFNTLLTDITVDNTSAIDDFSWRPSDVTCFFKKTDPEIC